MYFQDMVISFMKLSIKIHTTTIKPQTIMVGTKEALKNQEAAFKKETLFIRDQAYTTRTTQFIPIFLPIPFLSVGLKKLRTHQIVTK